jgi:hypothetical protein
LVTSRRLRLNGSGPSRRWPRELRNLSAQRGEDHRAPCVPEIRAAELLLRPHRFVRALRHAIAQSACRRRWKEQYVLCKKQTAPRAHEMEPMVSLERGATVLVVERVCGSFETLKAHVKSVGDSSELVPRREPARRSVRRDSARPSRSRASRLEGGFRRNPGRNPRRARTSPREVQATATSLLVSLRTMALL